MGTLTTWKSTFPLDLCDEVPRTLMSPKGRHGGSFVQAPASFGRFHIQGVSVTSHVQDWAAQALMWPMTSFSLSQYFTLEWFLDDPRRRHPSIFHVNYALFEFHPLLLEIFSVSAPAWVITLYPWSHPHGHTLTSPSCDQHPLSQILTS